MFLYLWSLIISFSFPQCVHLHLPLKMIFQANLIIIPSPQISHSINLFIAYPIIKIKLSLFCLQAFKIIDYSLIVLFKNFFNYLVHCKIIHRNNNQYSGCQFYKLKKSAVN